MTQGLCWCEVADEPVVVINAQPVKPSNGVEGKTEQTIGIRSGGVDRGQKRYSLRRGEVIFTCMKSMERKPNSQPSARPRRKYLNESSFFSFQEGLMTSSGGSGSVAGGVTDEPLVTTAPPGGVVPPETVVPP